MRRKYRLLDLFCCAGGASKGYADAGFEVTGVDIKSQPNYPYEFVQGDALEYLKGNISAFDVIHASPPCQGYSNHTVADSKWVHHSKGSNEPKLVGVVRSIIRNRKPYVLENVIGAIEELRHPLLLCGTMFGLPLSRHRLFETNLPIVAPAHPKCKGVAKRYALKHGIDYRDMSVTGKSRRKGCIEVWRKLLNMPWAKRGWELTEAIPPAYTKYIGEQIITMLNGAVGT